MVETVEILDGRLGKRSVERVRYVINNLLHLVFVKYGDISLVLCISTRLRLMTILSLLMKYLVIFHADPCNKSYIYTRKMVPITGRARSFLLVFKNKIERRGRQNKNNKPINLLNGITFSTYFKYTTQS